MTIDAKGLRFYLSNGWKINVYLPQERIGDVHLNRNLVNFIYHRHNPPWGTLIGHEAVRGSLQSFSRFVKEMVDSDERIWDEDGMLRNGGWNTPLGCTYRYFFEDDPS